VVVVDRASVGSTRPSFAAFEDNQKKREGTNKGKMVEHSKRKKHHDKDKYYRRTCTFRSSGVARRPCRLLLFLPLSLSL
jgi:hypothetical protein